jgi:hypothetical protein
MEQTPIANFDLKQEFRCPCLLAAAVSKIIFHGPSSLHRHDRRDCKKSQISVTDRDYIRMQLCHRQADCRQTTQRSIVVDLSAMAVSVDGVSEMGLLLMPDRVSLPHASAYLLRCSTGKSEMRQCGWWESDVCRVRYVQRLRRNRVRKVKSCSISFVLVTGKQL